MGAVQLRTPPGASVGDLGLAVVDHGWHEERVYFRVSGDTVAFSPALIATPADLGRMVVALKRSIDAVVAKGEFGYCQ